MNLSLSILGLLSELTHAQQPPPAPCPASLPGCGQAANLVTFIIPRLIEFMLKVSGAVAVVMIIWYGLMLIINLGDETKVTKGRWGVIYAVIGLVAIILSQMAVSFVVTEQYGQAVPADLVLGGILPSAVRIMLTATNITFALFIVYYGMRMVIAQGKADEYSKARTGILWTVLGAVLVNLANTIVQITASFFGL